MPAALAALVVYDPEADADANVEEMTEGARVRCNRRDHPGRARHEQRCRSRSPTGDWIGFVRGDGIVAVSGSLDGAACALLDHLITPGREIVTVITGARRRTPTTPTRCWRGSTSTVPTFRSRCIAAASRCTRTSSALNDRTADAA